MKVSLINAFSTLFLLVVIILPTGSIYGLNLKILLTGICAGLVVANIRGVVLDLEKKILGLVSIFILFFYVLSVSYGNEIWKINSHLQAFVAFFSVFYLTKFFCDLTSELSILRSIVNSAVLFAIVKVLFYLLDIIGLYPVQSLYQAVYDIFGFKFITLETQFGSRLHFPIDYLLPFAFIFLFKLRRDADLDKIFWVRNYIIAMCFIVIAILISYSRMLWFFTVLILAVEFRLHAVLKSKFAIFVVVTSTLAVYPFVDEIEGVWAFIGERYFGYYAQFSDSIRSVMFRELIDFAESNIILGAGLGSHSDFIRFIEAPWNYELQTLSFVGQFGILGAAFLIYVFFKLTAGFATGAGVKSNIVAVAWLVVCSINCFLLTSQGAIISVVISLIYSGTFKDRLKMRYAGDWRI